MGLLRLAPEWARQDAVILVWPHANSDWKNQLGEIENTYIELSRYISRNQKLILVSYNPEHTQHIQIVLSKHRISQDHIIVIDIQSDDTWVRDYGPIFVKSDNEAKMLNFVFDGWGNKFSHNHDDQFNNIFKQKLISDAQTQSIDFVLEAGNIDINDKGTLLSSSKCINRDSKNECKVPVAVEQNFHEWFGCEHVLWIHDVKLKGDDTDGHIDTLARFCNNETIAYTALGNRSDPNFSTLEYFVKQVDEIKSTHSDIEELVPLPLPQPIYNNSSQLPASYANFLITNHYIFVPVFNDAQDNHALKTLDELFPKHEIIDIDSTALIKQYGGIHCATMQIPEGFLK